MNILITGATGFVGSHILQMLLKDGHAVCATIRSTSRTSHIEALLNQCVVCNLDKISIDQIYRQNDIDCTIHCATYYGRSDTEYLKNVDSNILFPLELLTIGIDNGVKYFVNTDSFFTKQLRENNTCSKMIYMYGYTLSKAQFVQWGRMLAQSKDIIFINMLLEHVWGDGDKSDKFIPFITERCQKSLEAVELSSGMQRRDFVHISDVMEAYRIVLQNMNQLNAGTFVEYGVGCGEARTLREFTEILYDAVRGTAILKWGAIPMKQGEIMDSCADNTELRKIGWEPKIVSDESIRKIFLGGVFWRSKFFHIPEKGGVAA